MKKLGILLFCLILVIAISGCSGNSKVLQTEEYDVYENGELFIEVKGQSGAYNFLTDAEYNGTILGEYKGHVFSTKRGIIIGSTIEEVIKQYKGTPYFLLDQGTGEILDISDALSSSAPERYNVSFYTLIVNGKLYCYTIDLPDTAIAKDLGLSLMDWLKIRTSGSQEYVVEHLSMQFFIENGKIFNILITYMNYQD